MIIEHFKAKDIVLYQGDALDENNFKEEFIDLIVTSPPYNVGIDYNSTNDTITYEDYLSLSEKWLSNCLKWTKPTDRLCLNIPFLRQKQGWTAFSRC